MTDDKKPIETKDAEWESVPKPEFTGRSALNPFIDEWIAHQLINPRSPFNLIDNIKNGNIKFFKGNKEFHPFVFGEYQGTDGFTQPAKPELDARKLKVCDGNCEDCW